jgi:2-methylcitrate dehydratase
MSETLADRLIDFAFETRFETLPAIVVDEARRRWLDSLGCAAGALGEPAPVAASHAAKRTRGTPSVSLFGGGAAAPDWAAFANGVHIRYLDCNDT